MLLGPALDGVPGLVHVAGLALVGVGPPPVERRELPQLVFLPAQLALRPLQVHPGGEVFHFFGQPGRLPPRRLVPLFGLSRPPGGQPERGVVLRQFL